MAKTKSKQTVAQDIVHALRDAVLHLGNSILQVRLRSSLDVVAASHVITETALRPPPFLFAVPSGSLHGQENEHKTCFYIEKYRFGSIN